MIITNVDDYLYVKRCSLDLDELKRSCQRLNDVIVENFADDVTYTPQLTLTTKLFARYNTLLYPYPEFYKLYHIIRDTFLELHESNEHYIQCWLNLYNKGEFIDWHGHYPSTYDSWHGYFCVDSEPSVTSYVLPGGRKFDVENIDNTLVIGKSEGDSHRTWPWPYDRTRITIAFDIVPRWALINSKSKNHWIPL